MDVIYPKENTIMSYGKHQSFYLKENWITKGFKAINSHPCLLLNADGYLNLGIGKNMHQALKFWVEATYLAIKKDQTYNLTNIGQSINDNDFGCISNTSKILLHYFLVNKDFVIKDDNADTFIWFFNDFNERVFTKEYLSSFLIKFNQGVTSPNTLKRDIDCLLATYVAKERVSPEDRNISLFSSLGLIQKKDKDVYIKTPIKKNDISLSAFYYIFLLQKEQGFIMTLEAEIEKQGGLGKSFNLGRMDLIEIIELMKQNGLEIELTRTNNLDTIKLGKISSNDYMNRHLWG